VRFDSKTPIIVQSPYVYPLPFPKGEARKECADAEPYYIEHNIMWSCGPETPSNCVIFLL